MIINKWKLEANTLRDSAGNIVPTETSEQKLALGLEFIERIKREGTKVHNVTNNGRELIIEIEE